MSSIVISGDTSGAITLAAPAVSGTNTATLPAATGTVMVSGNMPAFSATYTASTTSTSGIFTKLLCATSVFDTNSNYSTSTSTFTPTVAGYYQIIGWVDFVVIGTSATTLISIYKNGVEYIRGTRASITSYGGLGVNGLVQANGTTDTFNIYIYQTSGTNGSTGPNTWIQGSIVRSA